MAPPLTPNDHLHYKLRQSAVAPPLNLRQTLRSILEQVPARPKFVLAVPMLGVAGGSERISLDLLRYLRGRCGQENICVVAPDAPFQLAEERRRQLGVPIVAFNDFDSTLDLQARIELFDRVMVELSPQTVHSVNSEVAWIAFSRWGQYYQPDIKLFGSIYSDIRTDSLPVGAFWAHLPYAIDHLAGIIADNSAIAQKAARYFTLSPAQIRKFTLLPSAMPSTSVALRRQVTTGKTLWLGRIAVEKRIDVLAKIASRLPERSFHLYGATHAAATPVDLAWLEGSRNVTLHGRFGDLDEIPFGEFDSFVLTTSNEGMPITVLEMAAKGVPVVAPDVGGLSEFINRDTGWLVSSSEAVEEYVSAIEEIASDPAEAARRAAGARRLLESRHSKENFERTLERVPGYLPRDV